MNRKEYLTELLAMSVSADGLAELPWDIDGPLVELEAAHISNALSRYLAGEVSAGNIEEWANAIECREDIDYLPESPVGIALHELANPLLTEPLSEKSAERLLASLRNES